MTTLKHPLIGKFVRISIDDEYYSISRFTADLGNGFLLAQRMSTRIERDLDSAHILCRGELAHNGFSEIFDSWLAVRQATEDPDEDREPIVKLVPKPTPTETN